MKHGIFGAIVIIALLSINIVTGNSLGYNRNVASTREYNVNYDYDYDYGGIYMVVEDGPGVKYLPDTIGIQVADSQYIKKLINELNKLGGTYTITYQNDNYIQVYADNMDRAEALETARSLDYVDMASGDLSLRLK